MSWEGYEGPVYALLRMTRLRLRLQMKLTVPDDDAGDRELLRLRIQPANPPKLPPIFRQISASAFRRRKTGRRQKSGLRKCRKMNRDQRKSFGDFLRRLEEN